MTPPPLSLSDPCPVPQVWPEGDLSYHKQITLPTLLIHGMKDKFVSLVEMCDMEKVRLESMWSIGEYWILIAVWSVILGSFDCDIDFTINKVS